MMNIARKLIRRGLWWSPVADQNNQCPKPRRYLVETSPKLRVLELLLLTEEWLVITN